MLWYECVGGFKVAFIVCNEGYVWDGEGLLVFFISLIKSKILRRLNKYKIFRLCTSEIFSNSPDYAQNATKIILEVFGTPSHPPKEFKIYVRKVQGRCCYGGICLKRWRDEMLFTLVQDQNIWH